MTLVQELGEAAIYCEMLAGRLKRDGLPVGADALTDKAAGFRRRAEHVQHIEAKLTKILALNGVNELPFAQKRLLDELIGDLP